MQNTRIILVRHGESLGNKNNLALGHTNLDLSPRGYEQVRATAEFLRDEKIDVIYSSDLLRAHNTAVPNAELHGLPINDCVKLRETFWSAEPQKMNARERDAHLRRVLIESYKMTVSALLDEGCPISPDTADALNELIIEQKKGD